MDLDKYLYRNQTHFLRMDAVTIIAATNASHQSSGEQDDPRDETLAKAEIAVLAVILAVTTVGNLVVLFTMYRIRRKMSRMHLFIMHLGLTDLVVAGFQVLPQMIWDITFRFVGSDLLCRVVKYFQVLSMFASTYMLIMMTVDRYIAVCHPLKTLQQPSMQAYLMIGATWLISSLLSLPQIFIFSMREVSKGSGIIDCWAEFHFTWGAKAYVTWTTMSIFVIPVIVLVVCYSLITYEICKNLKGKTQTGRSENGCYRGQGMPSRVSSIRTISRAKIRTVKMTFVIVLAYVFCWTPFFSVQMWSVWDANAPNEESSDFAFTITMLLASLSSCCNPWIYMFFSGRVLQDVLGNVSCCRSSRRSLRRQNSNGSLSSRRVTILTRIHQQTISSNVRPMQSESLKDFYPPEEETVMVSGVL
uniref:V3/V1b-type arginine vasotocin receptor n=1 Tax=Cynops pyrrhogaster TaxID=8330 RepID=A0ZT95_CYNPY|nr:V3/V1b-type arginine vasotocin receptor [Cynops pyrrhogaster]